MSDSPFFLRISITHPPIPAVSASRLSSLWTDAGKPSGAFAPSAEQPQPCTVLTPQASAYSKHTADNKLKIQNTAASGRNLLAYRV